MHILLADGDASRRTRMLRLLQQEGWTVSFADSVAAALVAFQNQPPDILLADFQLPEPGGVELCRQVRARATADRIQTILLLPTRRQDQPGSLGPEVDDLLVHPVAPSALRTRLTIATRALSRRREEAILWERVVRLPTDSPHPILELSPDGGLQHANPAALLLLESWGWSFGQPVPAPLRDLARSALRTGQMTDLDVPCSEQQYVFRAVPIEGASITLYGHPTSGQTPTPPPPHSTEPSPAQVSRYDMLTGLPHRTLFADRLATALDHARLHHTRAALAKIDIDNFCELNQAYGHGAGDEVIRSLAHVLQDTCAPGDTVCREAGDRFLVLLQGWTGSEKAETYHEQVVRRVEERLQRLGFDFHVTLSLGLAWFPDDADAGGLLLERVDHALAEAKRAGRDGWRDYHSAAGSNPLIRGSHLFPRLSEALQQHRIQVHYQPIIHARTGAVCAFEALARWHDDQLGWVSPAHFVPIAEARGLITELSRQIFEQAFRQLAKWQTAGFSVDLALNVSKRQLLDPTYTEQLRQLARHYRLPPHRIILEATERQALLQDPRCRHALHSLDDAGFRLALDDFGTGHSSFDMISDLPFDEVKVDMSLVQKARTPRGRRVLVAILNLCQSLKFESVVEGVEDAGLASLLPRIGATKLQGYHFSRPLPAETTLDYLSQHPPTRRRIPRRRTPK
jgi:diguanylate cyclase (GGDEF)-like protein